MKKRVFIGLTGASGVIYGFDVIKKFIDMGYETHIAATEEAKMNAEAETDKKYENIAGMFAENGITKAILYDNRDIGAAPASGSFKMDYYVIAPASMGFIGRTASGISSSLIERCADVAIKERKKIVILFREAPLSAIHLENMLTLSRAGAVIMPAAPAFYHNPKSIEDLISFTTGKILDILDIDNDCFKRWKS